MLCAIWPSRSVSMFGVSGKVTTSFGDPDKVIWTVVFSPSLVSHSLSTRALTISFRCTSGNEKSKVTVFDDKVKKSITFRMNSDGSALRAVPEVE